MQDSKFLYQSERFIESIANQIEEQDIAGELEVDFIGDVLNIETKAGIYVINRQSAASEIWLASPISGPYHFSMKSGKWVTKTGIDILQLLTSELSNFIKIVLNSKQ